MAWLRERTPRLSNPFDATRKDLGQERPADYLTEFDAPPTLPVHVLNVDLSTVTTAADLVLGLGQPVQEVVPIEFQASASADLHRDVLAYHALLHRRWHRIVILLRPQAQHPQTTGKIAYAARPERGKMEFGYEVIRLWERPVEQLLTGPLGTVPLAPLGQLPAGQPVDEALTSVVSRLAQRLQAEAPDHSERLLTAAYVLTGLRLEWGLIRNLFHGVLPMDVMRESSVYQGILNEGREEGREQGREEGRVDALQTTLLRQGRKRFGEPDAATRAALEGIAQLERLEQLSERLLEVASWSELLNP